METTFKIIKDNEQGEYQVQVFEDGVLNEARTYHTDDCQDAVGTLNLMIEEEEEALSDTMQNLYPEDDFDPELDDFEDFSNYLV